MREPCCYEYMFIGKNVTLADDMRLLVPGCMISNRKRDTRSHKSPDKVIIIHILVVITITRPDKRLFIIYKSLLP